MDHQAAVVSSSHRAASFTERFERADSTRAVEVRAERIAQGAPPMVIAMVSDVTEAIRAARALESAHQQLVEQQRMRALGELASGFAHDFNNTLHAVTMWIDLLGTGPEAAGLTRDQRRAVEAVDRVIRDATLRVGRIQDAVRAREDEPLESVDLAGVVENAIELANAQVVGQSQLSAVPVRIEARLPASLSRVRGVGAELRHVFLNLLLNARDAMPEGGIISIDATSEGASAVVTVSDEGTGIPEENLERIFDPFFTTKGERGTGLGLSMARNVMDRLGGWISAANRPGGGAALTLTFPLAAGTAEPIVRAAAVSIPVAKRRVLVIDDDTDNLEALGSVVRSMGHGVVTEQTGHGALTRVEAGEPYDLAFLDVGMPDMNGWEVAARLHAIAPKVSVFMLTGWAHEIPPNDPRRAMVAGVLAKPLDMELLREALTAQHAT